MEGVDSRGTGTSFAIAFSTTSLAHHFSTEYYFTVGIATFLSVFFSWR